MNVTCKPSCHIELPKTPNGVGFVFICPGRFELRDGRPCAGQTGRLLEQGIAFLSEKMPTVFTSSDRSHYLITNAWATVEFKKLTNRSVPGMEEISAPSNIERLYNEVNTLHHIVACGNLAHVAVGLCRDRFNLQAKVAKVRHTSRRALGCPRNDELHLILENWADSVIEQL